MVLACYVLVGIFFCAFLIYVMLEIHYFLRMLLVLIMTLFKKRLFILDESTMTDEGAWTNGNKSVKYKCSLGKVYLRHTFTSWALVLPISYGSDQLCMRLDPPLDKCGLGLTGWILDSGENWSQFCREIKRYSKGSPVGICLTTDLDLLLFHMNNARYVRELDFARFDFFTRTGLFAMIKSKGGGVVQGGNSIRYRKFIRPFTLYQIKSKILYWDEQNIYMEHRFVSPGDDFVRAIALGRHRIMNCNANDVMRELITRNGKLSEESYLKPSLPLDLAKWIECNEISSANLRNGI